MDFFPQIAAQLGLKLQQVQQALALLAEGNTVPFITRYRKEMTGGLDEDQLRRIQELDAALRGLEERRQAILRSIDEQGRLSEELRAALAACTRLAELEDLYLPYRPRRKTRASEARRRGLAPLAGLMLVSVTGEERWLADFCRECAPAEVADPSHAEGAEGRETAHEEGAEGRETARAEGAEGRETTRAEGAEGRETARAEGAEGRETARAEGAEGTETARAEGAEGRETAHEEGAEAAQELALAKARGLLKAPREIVLAAWCGHAEVKDPEAALAGARDILAEWLNERAELRAELRQAGARHCVLRSKLKDEAHPEAAKFRLYAEFAELLRDLPPHRVLALNRGERLGLLQLKLDWEPVGALRRAAARWLSRNGSPWRDDVGEAFADGLERLALPSLGRELRDDKTLEAEAHSLHVYAGNLRQLLLQAPLAGRRVMGIDPGFRTGCKVAVVDATGRLLAGATIYPHPPQQRQAEARVTLLELATGHQVDVVAIGNGTAGRETEELVAAWIAENALALKYCMVSEAGASVYSASEEAREEFPALDASQRGNISIARRLQDPLAELVKIDPRSLGVGQYQHDVDPRRLGERLDAVVESCVNAVGVDLNTASASLLRHVAGLTRRTSRAVVQWREEHGAFHRREQLREVGGIGPAAFRQCAGFLRIRDGAEALDNTGVHPESYPAVRRLFERHGLSPDQPVALAATVDAACAGGEGLAALAAELELGLPTLLDILAELRKPGRDPRDELDPPLMRGGVLRLEDLKPGMVLEGTVRNLVDFGAFVDVGLKTEGLIHVSQLSHQRVRHPMDLLRVGQRVTAQVMEVDVARGRLGLSLKALEEAPRAPRGHRPERAGLGDGRSGQRDGAGRERSTPPPKPAPGSLAEHWAKKREGR